MLMRRNQQKAMFAKMKNRQFRTISITKTTPKKDIKNFLGEKRFNKLKDSAKKVKNESDLKKWIKEHKQDLNIISAVSGGVGLLAMSSLFPELVIPGVAGVGLVSIIKKNIDVRVLKKR